MSSNSSAAKSIKENMNLKKKINSKNNWNQ